MKRFNSDEKSDNSIEKKCKDIEEIIVRLIKKYIEIRYNKDNDVKDIMNIWLKENYQKLEYDVEEVESTGTTDEDAIDNIIEILQNKEINIEKENIIRILNLGFEKYLIYNKEFIEKYMKIKEKSDKEIKTELEEWWIRKIKNKDYYEKVNDNEEEVYEILEQIKEITSLAKLKEIRKLLNWRYTEKEILDNKIILEYRQMKIELGSYNKDESEIREQLNTYVIE
ncbi:hypothetical protein RCL_jg13641.t1 [Rhizophagus clarus]|uniref:Uncharacterized protein n=1 Tax=Rhizophagus clarus TaxID=94130 RepID=A0A8H3LRJ2_9GLOM|nr:hypothetical protein RCL_jg13641.t1 [Rhizophagus clarus]